MAVAVMVEAPGMNATQYDSAIKDVMPNGQPPKGCQSHVAGPMDGGWRVVDVWDSQEDFDAFAHSALAAAFQKIGFQGQPKITVWPVHNIVAKH
jgi:hypothetical protein